MRLRILFILLATVVLLTGCSNFGMNAEDLMRPPKLSAEQQNIYSALSAAIGEEILLKYPQEGEFRSAFIMNDIDYDGEEEALVFYTTAAGGNVRLNILDRRGDKWYSMYDGVGLGPEVTSISFPYITRNDRNNIVVSFDLLSRKQKKLCVYSFKDSKLIEEFSADYTDCIIQDFDGDNRAELFLLYKVYDLQIAKASLVDTLFNIGPLTVMNEIDLSPEVSEYVKLSVEHRVEEGKEGAAVKEYYNICIDGRSSGGSYYTEVVGISNNTLTNRLDQFAMKATLRSTALMTQDRNHDGIMDIPAGIAIQNWSIASEESPVKLIQWYNYIDDALLPTTHTLIHETFGFSLDYPPSWNGTNISVKEQSDGFEWRIYEFDAHLADQDGYDEKGVGPELLRIRVYQNNDYFDNTSAEGYSRIGGNEEYVYYARLPETEVSAENMQIGWDELVSLFHF